MLDLLVFLLALTYYFNFLTSSFSCVVDANEEIYRLSDGEVGLPEVVWPDRRTASTWEIGVLIILVDA